MAFGAILSMPGRFGATVIPDIGGKHISWTSQCPEYPALLNRSVVGGGLQACTS